MKARNAVVGEVVLAIFLLGLFLLAWGKEWVVLVNSEAHPSLIANGRSWMIGLGFWMMIAAVAAWLIRRISYWRGQRIDRRICREARDRRSYFQRLIRGLGWQDHSQQGRQTHG